MTVELVETLRCLYTVLIVRSLDKPLDPDSEEELTLGDLLFSFDNNTEERALANGFRVTLRSMLERPSPVVSGKYWYSDLDSPATSIRWRRSLISLRHSTSVFARSRSGHCANCAGLRYLLNCRHGTLSAGSVRTR